MKTLKNITPSNGTKPVRNNSKNWHWSLTVGLLGFVIGIFTFVFIGKVTLISRLNLILLTVIPSVAGLLLPMRFYKKWFGMEVAEKFIFSIGGVGPLLTSVLLWSNFLVHTSVKEEIHAVIKGKLIQSEHFENADVLFELENDAYEEFPEARTISLKTQELAEVSKIKKMKLTVAKGCMGYRVVVETIPVFE